MLKNKKIHLFLILLAFIFVGYFREFMFVHTNTILYNKYFNGNYPVPRVLGFLNAFEYKTLYILKWFYTAFFCGLFYYLELITLKVLFSEKIIRKWLIYFYLTLLLLSVMAFSFGYLAGDLQSGYRFSRMFLGILQSPVPLMFLIPIGIFKNKFDKEKTPL